MMCQIYSNARRQAEGPPAADHVFGPRARLLLASRAISARNIRRRSAGRWHRRSRATAGSPPPGSATARRPRATSTTRSPSPAVYRAPVILNIVNNQWAISTFSGHRRRRADHLRGARRSATALPGLRVDGNDRARGLCRDALGGRPGAVQSRPDPDRASSPIASRAIRRATIRPPTGRPGCRRGLAARRSDRAAARRI